MHRLYRLAVAIVLIVSYVPLEVLSDGKLQEMADIVRNMKTTRLCDHNCKPVIKISNTNLTISYETNIFSNEDTDALCKCMYDYMKGAVGDATAACDVTTTQLALVLYGQYDPNKRSLPPLTTLANVLSHYEKPDLGGYECTNQIFKKDGRIHIKITYNGIKYRMACDGILKYLNQNNFLEGAYNVCTEHPATWQAVLDLWTNE